MENKAHALATGLFMLLLGAMLAAAVLWFRGDHSATQSFTVVARSGVPGLNVKAPVKLHGVMVGKVQDIEFDRREPRQILVSITVDEQAPIGPGTVARLGYQGITGLSFIELSDAEAPADPAASVLQTRRIELQPSVLDQIGNAGPKLLASAGETTRRLNELLGDRNQAEFSQTLVQLGQASAELTRLLQQLQPTAAALPALLRHADGLVTTGQASLAQAGELSQEGVALLRELKARAGVLDRLGAAAAQVEGSVRRLEAGLVGLDRPPRQQALVDELGQAARALERAANELNERPQSLILGPRQTPPGPGEAGFEARAKER